MSCSIYWYLQSDHTENGAIMKVKPAPCPLGVRGQLELNVITSGSDWNKTNMKITPAPQSITILHTQSLKFFKY